MTIESWKYFVFCFHTPILVSTSSIERSVPGLEAYVDRMSLNITLSNFRGNASLFTPAGDNGHMLPTVTELFVCELS